MSTIGNHTHLFPGAIVEALDRGIPSRSPGPEVGGGTDPTHRYEVGGDLKLESKARRARLDSSHTESSYKAYMI